MDFPQRDGISETTVPSEQGDIISNLSTKPNISQANDIVSQEAPNNLQRSSGHITFNVGNHTMHSERPVLHRSQSFDQINGLPIHFSAPSNLNLTRLPSEKRENQPKLKYNQSQEKLPAFSQHRPTEHQLKEQQQKRESFRQFINTDNELLLTQQNEEIDLQPNISHKRIDIIYEDNEPLISKNSFDINVDNQPLLTQKNDYQNDQMQQISSNQVKSSSSVSNQLKLLKYDIYSHQISQQLHSSQSQKSFTGQPLFEMEFKQSSQSNLLNFGFSVQRTQQNRVVNSFIKKEEVQEHRDSITGPNDIINNSQQQNVRPIQYQPMVIQKHSQHYSSSHSQEKDKIKIQINNCGSEDVNSSIKNNDIYGLSQRKKQQIPKYQYKQQENDQIKRQSNQIKPNIDKQSEEVHKNNQSAQPPTYQEIVSQLQKIASSRDSELNIYNQAQRLLKDHYDIRFLSVKSQLGDRLEKDGLTAIFLTQVYLLREPNPRLKQLLKKYVIEKFASTVSSHSEEFENYRKQHKLQINDSESVFADKGSSVQNSIQKTPNERLDIHNQSYREEPIKRSSRNYVVPQIDKNSQEEQGKETKKGKSQLKARRGRKPKTTTKKSNVLGVKFDQPQKIESSNQMQLRPKARKQTRSKSEKKSQASVRSKQVKNGKDERDDLGSKFTFIFRQNQADHKKQLVQRRVSQRLSSSKPQDVSNSKRRSSAKFEEEELDVDYIKYHLRQIKIKTSMMERDFGALTQQDEEIVELLKSFQEPEESSRQSKNQAPEDQNEVGEDTSSVMILNNESNTNSRARLQEFKKNISKYKVEKYPIVIKRIVDPNINQHGIYALLQLGRVSQVIYDAKYAITPLVSLSRARKKLIEADRQEAKRQVGEQEKDNIVYLQANASMLELIEKQSKRRALHS